MALSSLLLMSAHGAISMIVTIKPSLLIIKPDPSAVEGLLDGLPSLKSLKNSSKGDPGGKFGISRGGLSLTATLVAMFTTAGETASDKSAKLSGGAFENALIDLKKDKFIAKDTKVQIDKNVFNNSENEPRLNGVSSLS